MLRQSIIKLSAVAEVLFLIVLGNILFLLVSQFLIPADIQNVFLDPEINNIWPSSISMAIDVGVKNGLVLLLMYLAWRFIYKKSRVDMSITLNNYSLLKLIGLGFLTFAIASVPERMVSLINKIVPFGEGLSTWDTIYSSKYSFGLIIYVLAGNILLPPLLEEAAVRGFQLSRLKMAFKPISAILVVGVIFPLLHGHFYQNDAVVITKLITFIYASIVWTYVTYRCGSVVPAIIAHALANSPVPNNSIWLGFYILILIIICFINRHYIKRELNNFIRLWKDAKQERFDVFWIIPSLFILLFPVLIDKSYMIISLIILLSIIIVGNIISKRERKINQKKAI